MTSLYLIYLLCACLFLFSWKDKFVGSSEKNLRELFDNPPPVYDPYRLSGGKGMDKAALHVILLDE